MVTNELGRIDSGATRLKMSYEEFLEWADKVASEVLSGFWLRPAWLWQVDTLNPLTCVLEIEGVAVALQQQIAQAGKGETQE